MVWFQCEDCGENLKKPKLPSHFRMCRATKLSCIDCGEMFGRDGAQGHNQCITEAEKYGPKGQSYGTPGKPKDNSKPKPDFDINVGLSNRYPWFCSLCNTPATSQQTLLAHADGKKHRSKAKSFHAKQQEAEQSKVDKKDAVENASNADLEQKKEDLPVSAGVANGDSHAEKKRKLEALDDRVNNGEAEEAKEGELKKAKKQDHEKKIKWKKLITSALKSNKDKTLKMKKLKKVVLESLVDSGITLEKSNVSAELELKVNSSSRFTVDGKYVKLVAKD